MKKFSWLLSSTFVGMIGLWSCAGFVQSYTPPPDVIQDRSLDTTSQIGFMTIGVQRGFSLAFGDAAIQAGGLSDELFFNGPGATFPTFQQIDLANIPLDNNSVSGLLTSMGSYRFLADTLVDRALRTRFDTTVASERALRNTTFYNAFMHAGIARHLYAAYIGLEPRRGGGVIAGGPFIPSVAMHDSAIVMLQRALPFAQSAAQTRQINSIIAKCYIIDGRYQQALTAAQNGLRVGDPAFTVLYGVQTINSLWWNNSGRGRVQFTPDRRFARYIAADPAEGRIFPGRVAGTAIAPTTVGDAELATAAGSFRLSLIGPIGTGAAAYHSQAIYPNQDSPARFTNWQENSLMLAECALRINNDADEALRRVNEVRTSYTLATRTVTNLDSIYIERDKTLFGMGTRLCDQRRFNRWHVTATNSWQYLPITLPERNTNPNLRNP